MPRHDPPPTDDHLDHLLRSDADRVRIGASPGFVERVQGAVAASAEPLPFPRSERPARWPWYALAVAAVLALTVSLAVVSESPAPTAPQAAPTVDTRLLPEGPSQLATPSLAAIDLNPFTAVQSTPYDTELRAIGSDVRSTGAFLLSCLPDYPGSAR